MLHLPYNKKPQRTRNICKHMTRATEERSENDVLYTNHRRKSSVPVRQRVKTKQKSISCEIEGLVAIHLCKLRVILLSRVLRARG